MRDHPDISAETRERVLKRMDAGLDVPKDVALAGCGNVTYADFLRIDQQSEAIGGRAAKLALSLLEKRPPRAKAVLLEPKLVERASTQRKRRSKLTAG